LVNNAGYANYITMAEMSDEIFDETFENYIRAPFALTRAAIPHMRKQGAGWIIFIGSLTAQPTSQPYLDVYRKMGFVAYGAAKAAVHRMTTGWAAELEADNIAVNLVSPSTAISTPGADRYTSKSYPTERAEYLAETTLQLAYLPASERTGLITHSMHFPAQKGFTVYTLDGKTAMPPAVIPPTSAKAVAWTNEPETV
jgi:NAD(P)-dependent dehydrogenase (short-subunit alcohol dehydrogenase family)